MKHYFLLAILLFSVGCERINGDKGEPGIQGAPGNTGPQGPSGPQGPAGVNAPVVTTIKLCPSTPIYPNVFVEYAICLQGNLYGVYSANGGFLALLPPGNYQSNGIGSSCNFSVAANCVVKELK